MTNGVASLLASGVRIPIATPPAVVEGGVWPTLLTGSGPACHGMFSSVKIKVGTYDLQEATSADRLPAPPFWAHLELVGMPGLEGRSPSALSGPSAWSSSPTGSFRSRAPDAIVDCGFRIADFRLADRKSEIRHRKSEIGWAGFSLTGHGPSRRIRDNSKCVSASGGFGGSGVRPFLGS